MSPNSEIRWAAFLCMLLGMALVGWQWYEISSRSGATFIRLGRGFPVPVMIPGVLLLLLGFWKLLVPQELSIHAKVDLLSSAFGLIVPFGTVALLSWDATPAVQLGLIVSSFLGAAIILWVMSGANSRRQRINAFFGGLLLTFLPLVLAGAAIGHLVDGHTSRGYWLLGGALIIGSIMLMLVIAGLVWEVRRLFAFLRSKIRSTESQPTGRKR